MVKRMINFDHNAGRPVDPRVLEAMMPYFGERFGNPSSVHAAGQEALKAVEEARRQVAQLIGAAPEDRIIFTSGATEANNLAIIGFALRNRRRGQHIITSQVEHLSILNPCKFLERQGFKVTWLPVDAYGTVSVEALQEAIGPDTILVSVQHANGEVGTIQPIEEVAAVTKEAGVPLHIDAVASAGQIPIDVQRMGVSMLTLSSNDLAGPRGVGALYLRRETALHPILMGGGQEWGLRSGTENVPGIVGMGVAAQLAAEELASNAQHLTSLRDRLIRGILGRIEYTRLFGHPTRRLPNNANIGFLFIEGESITLHLSFKGFLVSTSSACTAKTLTPSHVLLAMGVDEAEAHGAIQFTLGNENTQEHIDRLLEVLPPIIQRLREMSPLTPASALQRPAKASPSTSSRHNQHRKEKGSG